MRTLGNIIWHIPFMGFLFALLYTLGGLLFCITIIGIPVGLGLLQFSLFLLSPFSKAMVSREDLELLTGQKQGEAMHAFSFIVRILYFPFGLFAAIGALGTIVGQFITLIGIPSGIVWAKSLSTIFNPVNKVCVPRAVAMEIERRKNEGTLNRYTSGNTSSTSNHTTNSSVAVQNKYMEKAMQKSDEELKELIQQKDDYNPELIKAAEKVLLARVRGTEVVMDEPMPQAVPYVYTNSYDFQNLKGDTLVMIGVLLPCITIITNMITKLLFQYQLLDAEIFSYTNLTISLLLHLAGIYLIFNGRLKMKEEKPEVKNTGVTLILIGTCLTILPILSNMILYYLSYHSICYITYTVRKCTTIIPAFLYIIAIIAGVILWKCSDKEKNTIGLPLICLATVLSYDVFYFPIAEYLGGEMYYFCGDVEIPIIYISIIILKILGWYLFVGPNKYTSNAINSEKN